MFYAGDDVAQIYPVKDSNAGALNFAATVLARLDPDDTPLEITGTWTGAVTTLPDGAGTERDLSVPLATLSHGLWSLRLVIDDAGDLFLGNVYIE